MLQYFSVLFVILCLSLVRVEDKFKRNKLLPLSFAVLTIFLAIRYKYGLDYGNYEEFFNNPFSRDREFTEFLFWNFFFYFDTYTNFVIAHTVIWCFTFFYFVRKYIHPSYYWLFFLVMICNNNMMFNFMSAYRSTMATCVCLFATEFFYLRKTNVIFYVIGILVASFFHTSSLFMLIIPVADLLRRKIGFQTIFGTSVLLLIGGMLYTQIIAGQLIDSIGGKVEEYFGYLEQDKLENATIWFFLLEIIVLIPILFMAWHYRKIKEEMHHKILFIAIVWFAIFAVHLDFQGRMSMFMYLFYIIAVANNRLYKSSGLEQVLVVGCVALYAVIRCYSTFTGLALQPWLPGNMLFYQTIFD